VILLLVSAALAADCPDLGDAINGISTALNDADLDVARELALEATAGLECQPKPVSSVVLTSLFQLAGSLELYIGEAEAAQALYERAVAVSPLAQIDPLLGEDAEAAYIVVRKEILDSPGGTLRVEGQVDAWLDGRVLTPGVNVDVTIGSHLLQWREAPEEALMARTVQVATRESRVLPLGEQVAPTPAPVANGNNPSTGTGTGNGTRVGVLAGGAGGVVVGAVLIGAAGLSHSAFLNETDPNALPGHQTRTNALALAGFGVGALGLAVGGVGFVLLDEGAGLTWSLRW
jgi:hypothetical protein